MDENKPSIEEIEVTPAMLKAGLEEWSEHRFGDDISYMLECVYRAMAYEASSPSSSCGKVPSPVPQLD